MFSTPPTKSERKKCSEARDKYFKCLDADNCASVEADTSENCAQLKKRFFESCPEIWVQHFSALRVQNLRQKELEAELLRKSFKN